MKKIDWEAVLEEQQILLREAMHEDYAWILEGADSSPYTFRIFDLQELIGLIEQGNYEEAYQLLLNDWGEDYFNDFLLP